MVGVFLRLAYLTSNCRLPVVQCTSECVDDCKDYRYVSSSVIKTTLFSPGMLQAIEVDNYNKRF
jgi:hypothetical protein